MTRLLSILLTICLLGMAAGCSGATFNSSLGAVAGDNAANATAVKVEALAGQLTDDQLTACIINGSDAFGLYHSQETGNFFTFVFSGKQHGLLITDANYVLPFLELTAQAQHRQNMVAGRWANTKPSHAVLQAHAVEALRDLVIVEEMGKATTTHVGAVALKMAKPPARKKAVNTQSLADIVASKLPAGWLAAYQSLPAGVRAQIDADLPIVAAWAGQQLQQWWANYLAGDTVAARVMVLDSMTDEQSSASGLAAGDAAEAAINRRVDSNTAAISALKDLVISFIPVIGSLFGL
jgi:hypothetical protein